MKIIKFDNMSYFTNKYLFNCVEHSCHKSWHTGPR